MCDCFLFVLLLGSVSIASLFYRSGILQDFDILIFDNIEDREDELEDSEEEVGTTNSIQDQSSSLEDQGEQNEVLDSGFGGDDGESGVE